MFFRNRVSQVSTPGKKIYTIAFLLFFIITAVLLIYGASKTSNQGANVQKAREQITLVKEGDLTVLNDDLLRADYTVFVKTNETNNNIFRFILIGMGALLVFIFAMTVIRLIQNIRAGATGTGLIAAVIPTVASAVIIAVFLFFILSGNRMVNDNKLKDPSEETLCTSLCTIVSKDSKQVKSGRGRTSHTTTYYYLHIEDGSTLSVSSYIYSEVTGAGTYYIAQNEKGDVFGVYSTKEYCMPAGYDF